MPPKGQTVLLVDDEASERRFMRRALEGAGFIVLEGSTTQEALSIQTEYRNSVDVVITDVALPGDNGYVLVRALLDRQPGLTAIFISGLAGAEVCRYHGMATTDLHFLEKPFDAATLLDRVRRVSAAGGPFLTQTAG